MLALTWAQSLLSFMFLAVCTLLVLLILIQKGRGGGLSGAFGGVGSYSPFGTKTGDALTWATVVLTAFYLLIAIGANYAFRPAKLGGGAPVMTSPDGAALPINPADMPADEPPITLPETPAPLAEPANLPGPDVPEIPPAARTAAPVTESPAPTPATTQP